MGLEQGKQDVQGSEEKQSIRAEINLLPRADEAERRGKMPVENKGEASPFLIFKSMRNKTKSKREKKK